MKSLIAITVIILITGCKKSTYSRYPFELIEVSSAPLKIQWKEQDLKKSQLQRVFTQATKSVDGLLLPQVDPYEGVDSTPEPCRRENLPESSTGDHPSPFQLFHLHSSQHYIFAFCPSSEQIVKTQYLLLYCEQDKKLYRIQYFYPSEQAWIKKPIARCKSTSS